MPCHIPCFRTEGVEVVFPVSITVIGEAGGKREKGVRSGKGEEWGESKGLLVIIIYRPDGIRQLMRFRRVSYNYSTFPDQIVSRK